ncbi:MAG TPA: sensor histidine kinase [Patescibacteria group bacterium]|nr:sensor histidine kinase [Patescibacteria group bacterium]
MKKSARKKAEERRDPKLLSLAGFRLRLVLLAAIVLVPLYAMLIVGVLNEYDLARNQVRNDGLRLVRLIALQQERDVTSARMLLAALARLPDITGRSVGCDAFVGQLASDNPSVADIGVADRSGGVYCAADAGVRGSSVANKDWFVRATAAKDFALGDYEIGASGKRTIGFGLPFYGADGALAGVVYAAFDLETLNRLASKIELPLDSVLTVVDRGGTILARYPDPQQWVGKTVPDAPLVRALRETTQPEGVFEAPGLNGVIRVFAFTSLDPGTPSSPHVTIGYDKGVLFAGPNRDLVLNILGLASLSLIVLLLTWLGGDYLIINRIRALQDVERLKSEFVSIASHQLRTPLTSLRWSNELLASETTGPLTAQQAELVRVAGKTIKDLLALVNDLLQASAFDAGTILHPVRTDLAQIARDAAAELAPQIAKKSLSFSASLGDGPSFVDADPLFLKQVVVNLLANAIRYTLKEGTVSMTLVSTDRGNAILHVADDGVGIPKAEQSRIFGRFFRASNVRSRHSSGTGLGLYLAKTVIERSGGEIGFSSRENKGSTFWFSLPLSRSGDPAPSGGTASPIKS